NRLMCPRDVSWHSGRGVGQSRPTPTNVYGGMQWKHRILMCQTRCRPFLTGWRARSNARAAPSWRSMRARGFRQAASSGGRASSPPPTTLAGRDPGTDLAVLKFDSAGLGPAEIGDTASLKVGHLVLAVGRVSEHGPSASLGVVSATGGAWRTWRGGMLDQFVRLDLAIYDGFSGGPLVDLQGRVVGLNTSGLTRGGALTIPTATVNRVVDEILARGHV